MGWLIGLAAISIVFQLFHMLMTLHSAAGISRLIESMDAFRSIEADSMRAAIAAEEQMESVELH